MLILIVFAIIISESADYLIVNILISLTIAIKTLVILK